MYCVFDTTDNRDRLVKHILLAYKTMIQSRAVPGVKFECEPEEREDCSPTQSFEDYANAAMKNLEIVQITEMRYDEYSDSLFCGFFVGDERFSYRQSRYRLSLTNYWMESDRGLCYHCVSLVNEEGHWNISVDPDLRAACVSVS
jgi:hypothetical protein